MTDDARLRALFDAIAARDVVAFARLLAEAPSLASDAARQGATRQDAEAHFLAAIGHYINAGDTALHLAAAAHAPDLAEQLLLRGAAVRAPNRRKAEPLHYAADGVPGSPQWRPEAQAAVIGVLIAAQADPNCVDASGVAPLHRAVRTRCAAAVRALLEGGADPLRKNKSGSTPMQLATQTTGRGGSGLPAARAEQAVIVELLRQRGG